MQRKGGDDFRGKRVSTSKKPVASSQTSNFFLTKDERDPGGQVNKGREDRDGPHGERKRCSPGRSNEGRIIFPLRWGSDELDRRREESGWVQKHNERQQI